MTIFSKEKNTKPVNTVYRLPVAQTSGSTGLLRSEFTKEQASLLYPIVSNTSQEEVDSFLSAGITAPLQSKAEAVTQQKRVDVYNEVIEVSSLDQKTPEQAISELETIREDNPFLKAYVSAPVLEALKQSDNPTARRAAQGKVANALIAIEILNEKLSESNTGFVNGVGDFLDTVVSDLPVLSAFNLKRRKELSDRFLQIMDSSEDHSVVQAELKNIIDEAADMGFFTDANRFYLNDFLGLTQEGGYGDTADLQGLFAGADILGTLLAIGDVGKLIGKATGSSKKASEALLKGVMLDDPSNAVDPAYWKESLITSGRTAPRSPVESTAAQLAEIDLRATADAIDIRLAAGSSIDDETFLPFKEKIRAEAIARAEKSGNLRYMDSDVIRDAFDNVQLKEYYGTSKGRAFTSQKAAELYAEQIYGKVIPVTGEPGKWMVEKASNVKTGIFSQGATPNDVVADLGLYKSLEEDELGKGFFANYGSPLSQTEWSNNAILKQGEFARAKAMELVERDVERQLRIVGKDGKSAVERVYTELRDGQFANMREAPNTAQFADMFFTINGRRPSEAELKLHELKLQWNDTDWYFTADMHFKRAVERGVEIIVPQDGIEVAAVKTTSASNTGRQVWDIDSGKYVAIDTLSEDRVIYKLVEPMEFDGKTHDLVASAIPKTRALKHTDVMGYNAGGSRMYARNRTNFMVKQDTEYQLADGVSRKGTPRTLMATKTEKEAKKAVSEVNSILTALHTIANPKAFVKAEDYIAVIKSKFKDAKLNDIISRNSAWNTDVHSVETLLEWASETNFDLRKLVDFVSDGQPLVKGDDMIGDITFKDVAIAPGPLKMGDFRKDNVLMGYGGQKVPTIAPFEAISRSVMSSISRQTEAAYETRSIMRLYKTALENNLLPLDNISLIRNMSLRQKARNMSIATGTDFGKKLELERKKILTRLEGQKMFDSGYHQMRESLANVLWDKGWKKASEKIDALSADPVAGTRGIVFDAYLGLGAVDQLYVQASQMFNVMAMADKTIGIQASAIAPYFRKTLMNGHKAPTEAMAKLSSGVLGVTPEQFLEMIDTFKASGKGYVNASVADLGEDSGGRVAFRKAREKLRVFYTEGELQARISAHIASSMEYVKKFPESSLSSQHGKRWVTNRSDILTNGMTSTSRHPIEQLPMMQFMSYSMRMAEWYFSGLLGGKGVLDGKKKAKLFTYQAALYGASAIPLGGYALDRYNRNHGVDLSESDYYQLRHGLIDNLLLLSTGVETELGRRLAWGEGLFDTISNLQDKSFIEVAAGPSYSLGSTALDRVSQMIFNIRMGKSSLGELGGDTLGVFKSLKSVNMYHNAWLAFRYDVIMSRKGDMLAENIPTGEAVAIALGVPLGKVNQMWREVEGSKKDIEWYKSAAKRISSLYSEWYFERSTNGIGTKKEREIVAAIEQANILYKEYMPEINRYVDKKFITMNEEITIEIDKREAKRRVSE